MANTANNFNPVNNNLAIGARAMSLQIVQTMLEYSPILAAFMIMQGNKPADWKDVGMPGVPALLSGASVPGVKSRAIQEYDQYNPWMWAVNQFDHKTVALNDQTNQTGTGSIAVSGPTIDTAPTLSGGVTVTGTPAFSVTLSGLAVGTVTMTGATITLGTATAPTFVIVRATGAGGEGARLKPVVASGTVTATFTVANGGILSGGNNYSSAPSVVMSYGMSAGNMTQRACYRWTHDMGIVPIREHDNDRMRALAEQQSAFARETAEKTDQLIDDALRFGIGKQIEYVDDQLLLGPGPTSDTATLWDNQYGLLQQLQDANVCAGVDRNITQNYNWRAIYDSTAHTFTLPQLWNDFHITKGAMFNGGKADICFVDPTLFTKFLLESDAYLIGANANNGVSKMREFGFKSQVIAFNDTLFMPVAKLPAGTALFVSTKTAFVAFKQGKKFSPSPIQHGRSTYGGPLADYFYLDTQFMLAFDAFNFGNGQYTTLT